MITKENPDISIVIPAYNEDRRLPLFLEDVVRFTSRCPQRYEIIVVDDGSLDRTFEEATTFSDQYDGVHVIRLKINRGKGYAVKRGLFMACGDVRVFMDADGSVHPREIDKNLFYFKQGVDVVIGSRVERAPDQVLRRKWWRIAIGTVFNALVKHVLAMPFLDTQCGFKMFRAEVIKPVFARMYLRRFGFDIELMFLLHKCGFKVVEVPVSWTHRSGSKVNLLWDSLVMLVNIFQVRNWHWTPINTRDRYLGPNEYKFMREIEDHHWWFTSRRKIIQKLIMEATPSRAHILDAGCGTGANLEMLRTLGTTFGIDASEQAIAFCKARGLEDVVQAPLENISCADEAFDVAVALDVVEHLEDPLEVLRSMRRTMKPGGTLIVTAPAFRILWSQHDEALCHFRRYSRDDFKALMLEGGFQIQRMGYLFFLSFFVVAPIRSVRRIFRRRGEHKSDTTTKPPHFFNRLLHHWFVFEYEMSRYIPLPLGTSLYAVCTKPSQRAENCGDTER